MKILSYNEALKKIAYKNMKAWAATEESPKKDPPIDKEMFDSAFIDFIDCGAESKIEKQKYIYTLKERKVVTLYEINIDFDENPNWQSVENFIIYSKKLTEILLDIESSINKIKIENPNIENKVYYHQNKSNGTPEFQVILSYPEEYWYGM